MEFMSRVRKMKFIVKRDRNGANMLTFLFFIETIPQKEYTKVVNFSTFLEDLLWSMYLHLKLQKFGIYHGVELRLCVEKVGLKERFLLQILGWYQKI